MSDLAEKLREIAKAVNDLTDGLIGVRYVIRDGEVYLTDGDAIRGSLLRKADKLERIADDLDRYDRAMREAMEGPEGWLDRGEAEPEKGGGA